MQPLRYIVALLAAAAVTFGLFYLMYELIANPGGIKKRAGDPISIRFGPVKVDETVKQKDRRIPKKPPPPKNPPPPPKMAVQNVQKQVMNMPTPNMPKLNVPMGGSGPYLGPMGGGNMNQDGDVIPVVRIPPMYPRRAAIAKIEGWVKLEFTITETGSVEDVKVVESKPPRVFDREAVRALYKWKFKPRIEDGVPMRRRATQTIDFKLEGEG